MNIRGLQAWREQMRLSKRRPHVSTSVTDLSLAQERKGSFKKRIRADPQKEICFSYNSRGKLRVFGEKPSAFLLESQV